MNETDHQIGSIITLDGPDRTKFVICNIYKGGMGIVYQLLPVNPFDVTVALKSYQDETFYEQFAREARIWFSIGEHPNIAKPFWYGKFDGKPSILAEWYLRSARTLISETPHKIDIFEFIKGIISGLDYAYRNHGIIHRDIKPDNILISEDNLPKVSDFGISVLVSEKLTSLAGTELYMAPELFVGYEPSVKTDIYALGVTLFEIVTGKTAYQYLNLSQRKNELDKIRRLRGPEFQPVIELILSSTQENPRLRASSYQELAGKIEVKNHSGVKKLKLMLIVSREKQMYFLSKGTKIRQLICCKIV